ncbi:MAG: redoxin domain-containing protein [candidate division Zixibacteria bacterium]|nr:redoxin domain-containing protein [candidate division Zixibacteria bacterium]
MLISDNNILGVSDPAPDFTLPTHNEGELNLAWYQGRKNVVLAFYPGDWTPVCSTQIPGYQNIYEQFLNCDCQLLGISVDSIPCHMAWAKSLGGLSFPLMSDFYPHGRVAQLYGVLTKSGYADRTVFLIDKAGIIRFIQRVKPFELPDNDELIKHLAQLKKG